MSSCVNCGAEGNTDDHHTNYENDETVPVCRGCHIRIHNNPSHELYPEDPLPGRTLNVTFSDDDFRKLKNRKGDRTWPEAITEEFGVLNEADING